MIYMTGVVENIADLPSAMDKIVVMFPYCF